MPTKGKKSQQLLTQQLALISAWIFTGWQGSRTIKYMVRESRAVCEKKVYPILLDATEVKKNADEERFLDLLMRNNW